MKTYELSGWTDRGTYETIRLTTESVRDAILVAKQGGLYPSHINEV